MSEAIADTGPLLHLHQIGRLSALRIVERVIIPDLVVRELQAYHVNADDLKVYIQIHVIPVTRDAWEPLLIDTGQPVIHAADAQVLALAHTFQFRIPVFTDDLALRQRVELAGGIAVGSVGILVRAYTTGQLTRGELDTAVDALFTESTLYMSKAFRGYVRRLLEQLA